MDSPVPPAANQRLFAFVLILLFALLLIFQSLHSHPKGKSRVGWPSPSSIKP